MVSRYTTRSLLAGIALLLLLRAGLSLSDNPGSVAIIATPPAAPITVEQAIAAATVVPTAEQSTAPAGEPQPPLEMIAAYIVPKAEAAANEASAAELPLKDQTLIELREYKDQLDTRQKALDQREASLKEAEDQLSQRITELEQLEASIQLRLADEAKIKNKKIKRLTAVYEGMKPEKAAPVIADMKLETVVKIFLLMDEKKVGKILSFLPPDKAVAISQALTRQISTVK